MVNKNKIRKNTTIKLRTNINQKSFDNVIKCMLELSIMIKLYHWNTLSYATHKATDQTHGILADKTDKYAEVMIGKGNGKYRINMNHYKTLNIGKIESNENMIKKVKNFIIYLNNFHSTLDSKIYSEVNNIRDEIVGELDTFLYLLTLHN